MGPWTGAQRAFAVKAFYKNGDSFVIAQREFRREFGIHRSRAVPSPNAIKTRVRNFEAKTKLRGLSPRANYTDRAAAAGRRS